MKRITWWPQVWLGLTFNWAVLVAYAAKAGTVNTPLFILYAGLIFWTVGYDTIYACQDIEDDMKIGVKSTARRFGKYLSSAVTVCYAILLILSFIAIGREVIAAANSGIQIHFIGRFARTQLLVPTLTLLLPVTFLLFRQPIKIKHDQENALRMFKSNFWVAIFFIALLCILRILWMMN